MNKGLISFFFNALKILDNTQKVRALKLTFLMFSNAIIDVLGLAFIFPVVASLDKNQVHENILTHSIFEYFNFKTHEGFALFMILSLITVFLSKNLYGIFTTKTQINFGYQISRDIILRQFDKELMKGYNYYANTNSNDMVRNIIGIPTEFASNIVLPLITIINEFIVFMIIATGIIIFDPILFLITIATFIPALFFFYTLTNKKVQTLGVTKNNLFPIPYKYLFNTLLGYIDVITSNRKSFFKDKVNDSIKELYETQGKIDVFGLITMRVIEILAIISMSTVFMFTIYYNTSNSDIYTFLGIYAASAYRLMPGFNRILAAFVKIKSATYVFDTIDPVNHYETESEFQTKIHEPKFNNEIKIENGKFAYGNNLIFENLNIIIKKGENIGIIGKSGAGKTTFINVLLGLLELDSGRLSIDNIDVGAENQSWFNKIGYVQQNAFLLHGNIIDNIAFGIEKSDLDINLLRQCIKQSRLEEFVDGLENKLEHDLGEFGKKISGGQKQRIAIARALYKNPELLIFDESTSSLDDQTEEELIEIISEINKKHNLTVISIAHRKSALKYCNRIIDLKSGVQI